MRQAGRPKLSPRTLKYVGDAVIILYYHIKFSMFYGRKKKKRTNMFLKNGGAKRYNDETINIAKLNLKNQQTTLVQ